MQYDGNLVVYRVPEGTYVWAAQTIGSGANRAVMQQDGQFCLYTEPGVLKWTTYTRDAGSSLRLQDDGNLVVINAQGKTVWNAFTGYGRTAI